MTEREALDYIRAKSDALRIESDMALREMEFGDALALGRDCFYALYGTIEGIMMCVDGSENS